MNGVLRPDRRPARRAQRGAEIIEFMFTFLLFWLVFMMIVDLTLLIYDQGVLRRAANEAARAASLYWVDIANFNANATDPLSNIKLNPARVATIRDHYQKIIINRQKNPINYQIALDGNNVASSTQQGAVINVTLDYTHRYIGLTGLLGVTDGTVTARARALSELDIGAAAGLGGGT